MNRRLIRPSLTEIKEKIKSGENPAPPGRPVSSSPSAHLGHPPSQPSRGPHGPHGAPNAIPQKKMYPPTDTGAENFYYLKQMSKKTSMAVVFQDGQVIEGYIEWYDRNCIKLNRNGAPNLLVYKNALKYMYKIGEGKESSEGESDEK